LEKSSLLRIARFSLGMFTPEPLATGAGTCSGARSGPALKLTAPAENRLNSRKQGWSQIQTHTALGNAFTAPGGQRWTWILRQKSELGIAGKPEVRYSAHNQG
jgi:hypothetical protein